MSLFTLYVFTVILPNLGVLLFLALLFGSIALFYSNLMHHASEDELLPSNKKYLAALGIIALVLMLIPSESQLYKLAGAYIVTNTEGVGELPDNIVKAANDFLKSVQQETADNQ